MKRKIVIIDNFAELEYIEKKYPNLKNSDIILLSDNFTLSEIKSLDKRKVDWIDQKINLGNSKEFTHFINEFLWNWFLDDDGNDLSTFEDFSLAVAFCPSIEILMTTISRYILGLKKLIKKNDEIFFSSNTEEIFLDIIYWKKYLVYLKKTN